jgi:hypothetical protein
MNVNSSLDFLNMIKTQSNSTTAKAEKTYTTSKAATEMRVAMTPEPVTETIINKQAKDMIAVIDTETNWRDEVMSLGVALADAKNYALIGKRYYIFDPECRVGGMFSGVMYKTDAKAILCTRDEAMSDVGQFLMDQGITRIFAYNAKFDLGHLSELGGFEWFDIMRIAAYRQFNKYIPANAPCCKTGRLKGGYGVEPIMHMLTGNSSYSETHNAVNDACDELKIVELLALPLDVYECARL